MATSFDFKLVSTEIGTAVGTLEGSLTTAVTGLTADNISPSTLLGMQTNLTLWSTSITMMTALNKEMGDTIKGIVQHF